MRPLVRAAVFAASAVFVALAPSGADAADATASGWWSRLQSGQGVSLPAPPGVEDGDLFVQGAPDGASAMAAVRFTLTETETAPVLQLRFAQEGAGSSASAAVVLACPSTTPWNAGGNQAWSTHPIPDCSRQAIGEVAEDGTSMTFDLSSFIVGDAVDLVILPGTVEGLPEGANYSTFTLTFDAPTDSDLVTQPAGSPVSAAPTSSGSSSSDATSPASASASATPSASSGSSGAVSRPPTPSFQPPATPAAPALPPSEVAAPAGSAGSGASVPPFEPASADRGDAKTLAVVLLIVAALATLATSRRDSIVQLFGGTPTAPAVAVAGLGRFAREREGAPPTLR